MCSCKTSNCLDVDSAKRHLFSKKGWQIENIQPVRRCCSTCRGPRQLHLGPGRPPSANSSKSVCLGLAVSYWTVGSFWTSLPEACRVCRELLEFCCKKLGLQEKAQRMPERTTVHCSCAVVLSVMETQQQLGESPCTVPPLDDLWLC